MPRGGVKGNRGGQKGKSGRKSKLKELGLTGMIDVAWPAQKRLLWFLQLVELTRSHPDVRVRLEAGTKLENRYYGKTTEHQHITGGVSITVKDDTGDA